MLGKHFRRKTPILGMTRRGGKIRAMTIPNRETHVVLRKLTENVDKKAHVMTDDAGVYRKVVRLGYKHDSIKHSRKQYVRGDVHTNFIESFWALFKRNYHGTYHSMSKKHLQRYIDEVAFRFNQRGEDLQSIFDEVTKRVAKHDNMTYKNLTA